MDADCYCDYDPPEFYSKRTPVAAKEHRCEECGKLIRCGEMYEYVAAKWPEYSYFDVYKTCVRCCDLRQWVLNNVPCFCWYHHAMLDNAVEAIDEACWRAPDETKGLRFGFWRRMHAVHNSK